MPDCGSDWWSRNTDFAWNDLAQMSQGRMVHQLNSTTNALSIADRSDAHGKHCDWQVCAVSSAADSRLTLPVCVTTCGALSRVSSFTTKSLWHHRETRPIVVAATFRQSPDLSLTPSHCMHQSTFPLAPSPHFHLGHSTPAETNKHVKKYFTATHI